MAGDAKLYEQFEPQERLTLILNDRARLRAAFKCVFYQHLRRNK